MGLGRGISKLAEETTHHGGVLNSAELGPAVRDARLASSHQHSDAGDTIGS